MYDKGMTQTQQPTVTYYFTRPGGLGRIGFTATDTQDAFAQFYRTFPGHGAILMDVQTTTLFDLMNEATERSRFLGKTD